VADCGKQLFGPKQGTSLLPTVMSWKMHADDTLLSFAALHAARLAVLGLDALPNSVLWSLQKTGLGWLDGRPFSG